MQNNDEKIRVGFYIKKSLLQAILSNASQA